MIALRGGALVFVVGSLLTAACGCVVEEPGARDPLAVSVKPTASSERAARRAFDGAPPVIPHPFGGDCLSCHTRSGTRIENMGVAPACPHEPVGKVGAWSRCGACHVHRVSSDTFVASSFEPFAQNLRRGERQHPFAPPVMPHQSLARENCVACHTGEAARPEIRCDHPERGRCTGCHLEAVTREDFVRSTR